jgi:hypothetical protein
MKRLRIVSSADRFISSAIGPVFEEAPKFAVSWRHPGEYLERAAGRIPGE